MVSAVMVERVPEVIAGTVMAERKLKGVTRTAMRERVPEVIAGTAMAERVA